MPLYNGVPAEVARDNMRRRTKIDSRTGIRVQEDDKPKNNDIIEHASMMEIIMVFGRIGLTSFGGGLSAWIYLESVERRRWLTAEAFFAGLALAQILPGPNVLNLAIFIGHRLRGIGGATVALSSLLLPPMVVVIALAMAIHHFGISAGVQSTLQGIAAGAVGVTLCVGFRSLRNASRHHYWPLVIAALTFVAIGLLHIALVYVVVGLLPVAFMLSWKLDKDV